MMETPASTLQRRLDELRKAIAPSANDADSPNTVVCGAYRAESYEDRMKRLHEAGDDSFGNEEIGRMFRRMGRKV